ncbi:hypothetical protein K7432_011547 [Basidiobolus ranarum]|uniref:HCP-like protein n=1 Tax=Basidiobolus ranarum TaxID=34480 RepID=A0ABR2VU69_9FUNG
MDKIKQAFRRKSSRTFSKMDSDSLNVPPILLHRNPSAELCAAREKLTCPSFSSLPEPVPNSGRECSTDPNSQRPLICLEPVGNNPSLFLSKSDDFSTWVPYEPNNMNSVNVELADQYIQKAIQSHESSELEKAAHFFRLAACQGSPIALFLYGISLRHGWGCKANPIAAFQCLQKAAECAVFDLSHITQNSNLCVAKEELVLAIYELGVSFQNGWGVMKNKMTAAYYFEIAANLGDPDAQNDLAFCYMHGHGVKKDRFKAAKYYRMAHAQGMELVGNSWIFKEKYDKVK